MFSQLLQGASATIEIVLAAMCFSVVGGVGLGMLNSPPWRVRGLSWLIDLFVSVIRGTPLFVQVLILYFALPQALGFDLSPFSAGVWALGMNSSAYISEIVRCGIASIPEGQWDAVHVLGYGRVAAMRSVILPQMIRNVLPALTNEMAALIKETSILMIIGVTELTKAGRDIVARELDPMPVYLTVAAMYYAMTTSISLVSRAIERRLKK